MHLVAGAAVLSALVLKPSDGLSLQWDAPAQCPDGVEVTDAFDRHAKGGLDSVYAQGRVAARGAGYVLTLQVRSAAGEETRVIEASDCDALAETAGLLIAVASEPALVPPPEPAPSLELKAESGPDGQPESEDVPASRPNDSPRGTKTVSPRDRSESSAGSAPKQDPRDAKLGWVLGVDGQLQVFRLLPQVVGGGFSASFGVLGGVWRAVLRASYTGPQSRDYPDLVVGGSFDLWTVGAAGCWEPHQGRLSFPLCGGVEAGSLRGETLTVGEPGRAGAFFAGLTTDSALVFAPTPRLALRAGIGGVFSARRPAFHVRDQGTLFRAGPGALRASLGIEIRFR